MWIRPLVDADASCGAKASGLARLIGAGLRVPDGFVLDRRAFHHIAAIAEVAPDAIGHALADAGRRIAGAELPAELDREVRDRAAALGRLAVRSSASIEDGVLGAAAGVFASLTDVAPGDVWDAVRTVWTSALTPLAVAYARRRAAAIAISVIVQRFVPGERMTIYTRAVGAPDGDELLLSRGGRLDRIRRAAVTGHPQAEAEAELALAAEAELALAAEAELALAAEAAIGATHGADVELVLEAGLDGRDAGREVLVAGQVEAQPWRRPWPRLWIVQARPIIHPVRRIRPPPPPIVVAPLVQDGRRWTWDIAHNPDPLSPAQAGLVAAVERAAASPHELRVCGGYLYATPRAPLPAPPPPADRAELAARLAAIEARFVLDDAATVAAAVERYVAFMRIWAYELSPLVAAARAALVEQLAATGQPPGRIPALVASLIGPRRVQRDRVMSPAWDVAVATFAERAAHEPRPDPAGAPPPAAELAEPPHELAAAVDLARTAADAAEHDDIWFARAQWLVRRALLERSAALELRGDDIFWLPLDEVITLRTLDPDEAHRRASAARAAHARAAEWDMPLVVHGVHPDREPPGDARATAVRGVGFGPRVVGRVVRFASLASGAATPIGRGDVIVTRAITPALAMVVDGCAALVSETGGLLDHGAALARELGITCVVGCAGAWTQLGDGTVVTVDGDAGLVEPAC